MGLVTAGLAAGAQAQPAAKSPIAVVTHAAATDERGRGDAPVVRRMVDSAIRAITGKEDLAEAWRQFVSPSDVVGLKINLRGGKHLSTQPCVVDAIVAGLLAAGVKDNNIIVWDAWTRELPIAGYTINESDTGVRYFATDRGIAPPKGRVSREKRQEGLKPNHSGEPVAVADQTVFFTKILTEEITALINVPMIKDHRIAGVTCSMKNHYGSILNPDVLHGNACDPYLAALNAAPAIRDKQRLILVDGLRALYSGGPRDNPPCRWRANTIIASADPVATDQITLDILERKRAEEGVKPIGDMARHVATAAQQGLGTNNRDAMELHEIDLA